jgi:hypothetical protein
MNRIEAELTLPSAMGIETDCKLIRAIARRLGYKITTVMAYLIWEEYCNEEKTTFICLGDEDEDFIKRVLLSDKSYD